jgi:uncharacterized protein (TIGR02231 family)
MDYRIVAVTIFNDRALITRSAKVSLEKGEHTLIFENMPVSVEQNSIQVNGSGNAVLGNVKYQTVYEEEPETSKKALLDEKTLLEDQIRETDDQLKRLAQEKSFVEKIGDKVTTPVTENANPAELQPETWIKMVDFYQERLRKADENIRQTEKHRRTLQEKLQHINWQLQQSGTNTRKIKYQVAVSLEMKTEGEIELHLSYIVFNAQWYPVYDLRVDSEQKKMNITYHAVIEQQTGESWEDVSVKVSTAKPNVSGVQPQLSPWRIDIYYPLAMAKPTLSSSGFHDLKKKSGAPVMKEEVEEMSQMFNMFDTDALQMEMPKVEAETGATAVFFNIAGKHTVKTGESDYKVTILQEDFSSHFRYSAVPKLSPYAYLKAKTVNSTEFPFLAGSANVFLDGNFVATSYLKTIAPTEEFWTFLGIDESFKVEHKFIKKFERKEAHLFSKKTKVMVYEYQIKVKNHKKTQEEIVIFDQLPITQNKLIKVDMIEPVFTENNDKLKKNELEYLEWFFKPQPGEEILIPFKFSVEFPQDEQVSGLV